MSLYYIELAFVKWTALRKYVGLQNGRIYFFFNAASVPKQVGSDATSWVVALSLSIKEEVKFCVVCTQYVRLYAAITIFCTKKNNCGSFL